MGNERKILLHASSPQSIGRHGITGSRPRLAHRHVGHRKDNSPLIDEQGKVVLNWMISSLIYSFVSAFLCFFLVGIPLLAVLLILMIVFPIIGGIKANEGIVWKYPLCISFFSASPASDPTQ